MSDQSVKSPSYLLLMLEGRAFLGLGTFFAAYPFLSFTPKGDGHPVLVLPGLLSSDYATGPLRFFLKNRGYAPHRWRLGTNMGDPEDLIRVEERIAELYNRYQTKVSLIGWSLGGVYARAAARAMPQCVRQVITLASPFAGLTAKSNAKWVYELVSGKNADEVDPALLLRIRERPPVPSTAIYSQYDGVVSWQHCMEQNPGPLNENVAVYGSHFGMGHNPSVLACIADRLAQPIGSWAPFEKPPFSPFIYPKTQETIPEQ
jgi:pimeloyl-ACP methyl ester carboxylesterase